MSHYNRNVKHFVLAYSSKSEFSSCPRSGGEEDGITYESERAKSIGCGKATEGGETKTKEGSGIAGTD
jgi:hypothetical protein